MTEIDFKVVGVRAEKFAAVPTLTIRLHVEAPGTVVHSLALRCQIRIEPQRRRYNAVEEHRLLELFGETPRWGDTLKPFLWTHVSTVLPGFDSAGDVELSVPCSYDFDVAAAKYFHSLEDGEIPLLLLFSGTIFAKRGDALEVTQVPWTKEATYRLPVLVWRELMDQYFPNGGWLRLRRDTLSALLEVKALRALATFDDVIDHLLSRASGERR